MVERRTHNRKIVSSTLGATQIFIQVKSYSLVPLSKALILIAQSTGSTQEYGGDRRRVSVLYTGHVKEPESLFDEELGTLCPGFSVSNLFPLQCGAPLLQNPSKWIQ